MMTKRMGVSGWVALLAVAALGAGCGDDKKDTAGTSGGDDAGANGGAVPIEPTADAGACEPGNLPKLPATGLGYPDSYCGKDGCVADACDPFGRCMPTCNAWALAATMAFHAVTMKPDGKPSAQTPVTGKDGEDVCPGNMVTPEGVDVNCCQRGDNTKTDTPALKLTSFSMTRPLYFASAPVSNVNKAAIESDRYNWVSVLSSGDDGDITVRSGNATPNADGSFTQVKGAFTSGGVMFNKDGLWDAQTGIPGSLSTEGAVRTLTVGPTSPTKDYVMVMWFDDKYDFAQLELHMRGLQWTMPLDKDLACAGERTPGQFQQVGTLSGFVPLEPAIDTEVYLSRTGSQNLCKALSGAKDCKAPMAQWKAGS